MSHLPAGSKLAAGHLTQANDASVRGHSRTGRRAFRLARPYLYILPTFFFLFIFTHYPILKTFYMSLFKWNLAMPKREFLGLGNYGQAWSAPLFWQVLQNNVLFAVGTVPLTLALALTLALLINQKIRGLAIYRALLFYPTMIPMAAAAMIWLWILENMQKMVAALQAGSPPDIAVHLAVDLVTLRDMDAVIPANIGGAP